MPTPGLSLVGFLDQPDAFVHLLNTCVPANPAPPALLAGWQTAQSTLGPAFPNAGSPRISAIPPAGQAHIQQLQALPWVAPTLAGYPQYQFAMIEIDPLLAFQTSVCFTRSNHHCGALSSPPSLAELLDCCLPLIQPTEEIKLTQSNNSALLTTRSLNVRPTAWGVFQHKDPPSIGMEFGISLSLAHVVEFAGKYYLHNGYHRAVGARLAGATEIPCLLRPVATPGDIGLGPNTFPLPLLQSANPPALGHYGQGRAHNVQLREMSRVLHVSWFDYVVPRE